jgi:hypothetical protein
MLGSYFELALTAAAERGNGSAGWARAWCGWVGAAFLRAYLRGVERSGLMPDAGPHLALLLDVALLRQALHAVGEALRRNPARAGLPLRGLLGLLGLLGPG